MSEQIFSTTLYDLFGDREHAVDNAQHVYPFAKVESGVEITIDSPERGNKSMLHEHGLQIELRCVTAEIRLIQYPPIPLNGAHIYFRFMLRSNSINVETPVLKKNKWLIRINIKVPIGPNSTPGVGSASQKVLQESNARAWCTIPFEDLPAESVLTINIDGVRNTSGEAAQFIRQFRKLLGQVHNPKRLVSQLPVVVNPSRVKAAESAVNLPEQQNIHPNKDKPAPVKPEIGNVLIAESTGIVNSLQGTNKSHFDVHRAATPGGPIDISQGDAAKQQKFGSQHNANVSPITKSKVQTSRHSSPIKRQVYRTYSGSTPTKYDGRRTDETGVGSARRHQANIVVQAANSKVAINQASRKWQNFAQGALQPACIPKSDPVPDADSVRQVQEHAESFWAEKKVQVKCRRPPEANIAEHRDMNIAQVRPKVAVADVATCNRARLIRLQDFPSFSTTGTKAPTRPPISETKSNDASSKIKIVKSSCEPNLDHDVETEFMISNISSDACGKAAAKQTVLPVAERQNVTETLSEAQQPCEKERYGGARFRPILTDYLWNMLLHKGAETKDSGGEGVQPGREDGVVEAFRQGKASYTKDGAGGQGDDVEG